MDTQKVKKGILFAIPTIMFGYAGDKLAFAWRITEGTNISEKLFPFFTNLGVSFANPAPSLHPIDLFIGLALGILIQVIMHFKRKNAKKFRHGEEYGAARWGTPKDIEPYMDKSNFENNIILTQTERLTMGKPSSPKYARNKNVLVIGGSGSGKTRFFLKPNLMQMHSSYVVTDPKGTVLVECGKMLQRNKYQIRVFNTVDFKKSMHYNPFAYIRPETREQDILKFVEVLIKNTSGSEQKGEDFWTKAERLLYTAYIAMMYTVSPPEEWNFATLIDMINCSECREEDETFQNAIDIQFSMVEKWLNQQLDEEENLGEFEAMREISPTKEQMSIGSFAVKQYKAYKLAAGVVCSKRLLNQAVGKSLRTHNLKPKKGAQVVRKNEKITALYERLSRDDFGKDDDQQRESNSISNQELLCRGWFLPPNTYDCGSFVVNGTAVVGKEAKSLITAANQHKKELIYMKSIFEQMGGTYRQEGDYLIPNLALPEEPEYQIGKYGRMRRSYLKEHRPVLYANLLTSGTLHRHLAEIDQACNERMEIIVSDMARQEDVTEALKAADQME